MDRERRIRHRLAQVSPGVRGELLHVLASPPDIRANLIGQMYERPDTRDLAEALMDLEAEPSLRLDVMQVLKDALPKDER